jgi:hypothetical protein
MNELEDGSYDVFIIDAEEDASRGAMRLELTITRGEHKGEVVSVTAPRDIGDEVELLGLPGVLEVTDGVPRVIVQR